MNEKTMIFLILGIIIITAIVGLILMFSATNETGAFSTNFRFTMPASPIIKTSPTTIPVSPKTPAEYCSGAYYDRTTATQLVSQGKLRCNFVSSQRNVCCTKTIPKVQPSSQ